MTPDDIFPSYIERKEEQKIYREIAQVQSTRKSRVILLYGRGGVGKTWLVRELARTGIRDDATVWLDPIDVDDSNYWLLSNLEREIASRLDPDRRYFGSYFDYVTRLPGYTRPRIGHETVVSHLGRIKRVFVDAYQKFTADSGKAVVVVFDTVEAIRGMYLLLTLTQWMKELPATLFILSGRPVPGDGDEKDPIRNELENSYRQLPVTTVDLGGFTIKAALSYLDNSLIGPSLTDTEKKKLVYLTRGHPLWLAFAVSYLNNKGIPEELETPLAEIKRDIPYRGALTSAGENLQEAFKRRLVTPYRDSDFWHEAVKRLAVLRQGINLPVWRRVMSDHLSGSRANTDQTWQALLDIPWIRPRANRTYVTLHDAVAEELAQRIIPMHDQGQQWRSQLWQLAVEIYSDLADDSEPGILEKQAALDEKLVHLGRRPGLAYEGSIKHEDEGMLISDLTRLEAQKRELDQLKAARLFYLLLCDPEEGCRQFLESFRQASDQNDALFLDLLALEMHRFLPGGAHRYAFGDVIADVISDFRTWLTPSNPAYYLEIGLSLADYFIKNEQPQTALDLLESLPMAQATGVQRYRFRILRGNSFMRIPGKVQEGLPQFTSALEEATALSSADRTMLLAQAHKELGFYYRNEGNWLDADTSYRMARDALNTTLSARSGEEDREEMASIQTNWAYVKGLGGDYRDGANLVESAITVRHRLRKYREEGISWSVIGEIYRYERRFQKAWDAYSAAEQIFHGERDWSWLGIVYQEQAICLFQAMQDEINLTPDRDPVDLAKHLITLSLDICRDQAVRGYPSALNRAGRIFGGQDPDMGLDFLAEGIKQAHRLSDGWFWFANLIEFVELSYQAWADTGIQEYRDAISERAEDIQRAIADYKFPDLVGRWTLLQAHLGIRDWRATGDMDHLASALRNYSEGFVLVAQAHVGAYRASVIPIAFTTFRELLGSLTPDVQAEWQDKLRRAWSETPDEQVSDMLLARLEELY